MASADCKRCGAPERQRSGLCRSCDRERVAAWRLANPDKVRAINRRPRQRDPEKRREYKMRYLARNPGAQNTWRENSPELQPAYRRVAAALKRGELTRPTECQACGRTCKPQAAHEDYSRPLLVRWLCVTCHVRWDDRQPKSSYSQRLRRVPVQQGIC